MSADASNSTPSSRRLGATEELFWLYDLASPFHFVMAATTVGRVTLAEWRDALRALQMHHPLMRMRIDPSTRTFEPAEAEISLRVLADADTDWQTELAAELGVPFLVSDAPLVRATLIVGDGRQTILLSAHHSVADGISLGFALRDLLLKLGGRDLQPVTTSDPQERGYAIAEMPAFGGASAERDATDAPSAFRVDAAKLSREHTDALLQACRLNGTTLQGLLLAALAKAVRSTRPADRDEPIRILVPVSTTSPPERGGSTRVAITINLISGEGDAADVWALARTMKARLAPAQDPAAIQATLRGVNDVISAGPGVGEVAGMVRSMFTSDGMVTNIGLLPFDTTYGDVELTEMWGPAIQTGAPGEQVLGVLTLGGELHLTLTTQRSMPELMPLLLQQLADVG